MAKTREKIEQEYNDLLDQRDSIRDKLIAKKRELDRAYEEERLQSVLDSQFGEGRFSASVVLETQRAEASMEADNGK